MKKKPKPIPPHRKKVIFICITCKRKFKTRGGLNRNRECLECKEVDY